MRCPCCNGVSHRQNSNSIGVLGKLTNLGFVSQFNHSRPLYCKAALEGRGFKPKIFDEENR
ncbi:hypothetical protein CKA32_005557 [Geitlerinema sp. FC II]|nr:hypothetical protein CKA32_005557 [Geitlerinema sp. FC II]